MKDTCCNQNCNQGRDCPNRKPKERTMPAHGQSKSMILVKAVVNTVVGLRAWWICKRPSVVEYLDRIACWYGHHGRGAAILHSAPPCAGCSRCMKQDQLRAKFDEESA